MAYRQFKNVKNRIGRLRGEQLVDKVIRLLHHPDVTRLERIKYYEPWHLLLLLEWIILYGNFSKSWILKSANDYQVDELINRLKDLSAKTREFQTNTDVYLFARNMAFQQFWVQQSEATPIGIARQFLLFANLEESHVIQKSFHETIEVPIHSFLELTLALVTYAQVNRRYIITVEDFRSWLHNVYEFKVVQKFLDSISKTIDGARSWLMKLEQDKPESMKGLVYEYFEPSPFTRYPLIKCNETYLIISPNLLGHSLSTFVYDTLRAEDAGVFMNKFGEIFERLVEKSLRSVQTEILTENDLRRHFKRAANQRFVDFLIVDNGCNIFVEAKGVTMSLAGIVTDRAGTVQSQVKDSVLKGIQQGNALAEAIPKGEEVCGVKTGVNENYLIIVTFKDLYLGNGLQFREFIASEKVDKITSIGSDKQLIPLSNIFIVSIDELDILLGNVSVGSKTLVDYLESAVELVKTTAAWSPFRKLVFEESDAITILPYLRGAWDELTGGLWAKANK